jgi:hypothetical protein
MAEDEDLLDDVGEEDGLWFDYAFVEFLKTNYSEFSFFSSSLSVGADERDIVAVQRSILLDPNATESGRQSPPLSSLFNLTDMRPTVGRVESTESTEFVAALRSTISAQSKEMDELRTQILAMDEEREEEVRPSSPFTPLSLLLTLYE